MTKLKLQLAFCIVMLFCVVGCTNRPIVVHKGKDQTRVQGRKIAPPSDRGEPSRMVVTIFENQQTLWTFKIVGLKTAIDNEERWRPFIESISFNDDGTPTWKLPNGWSEGESSQFVFAKIRIPSDSEPDTPALEISVSDLPAGQDLAANVNRWRGQLRLPPTQNGGQDIKATTIKRADGDVDVLVYDEVGYFSGAGMGGGARMPTAQVKHAEFDVPAGFEELSSPSPLIRKFEKVDGEKKIEISVTQLPAQSIGWNEVVNLWANQIGLEVMSNESVMENTSEVKTENLDGLLIRLDSTEKDLDKSIQGLMATRDQASWFVKMAGDTVLIDAEQENFNKMIESISFDKSE